MKLGHYYKRSPTDKVSYQLDKNCGFLINGKLFIQDFLLYISFYVHRFESNRTQNQHKTTCYA